MSQVNNRVNGQMFLLCKEGSLEKIMEELCGRFGIQNKGSGNTLTLNNGDISVQVQVVTREQGEEAGKFLDEQKNGVAGHFYQAPAQEGAAMDRKINVLHQIRMTAGFCGVNYSFEEDHVQEKELQIVDALSGVLSSLRGLLLVVGKGEDLLLDGEGRIVLSDKGRSQVERFMPYMDRAAADALKAGISQEQIQRRARSRALFEAKGIYVMEGYPYLEKLSEAGIRSTEEMADRTAAFLAIALYSECMMGEKMPPAEARAFVQEKVLKFFGGDSVFSPKEKAYFYNDDATEQEKISFSWQYENLYVMEWALGLLPELAFPDAICDVPLVVRTIRQFEDRDALLAGAKARSGAELLDACDLIFCLDWACVDARIYRLPAPAGMDGGVVMERHRTLNWLVGNDAAQWDDVSTNT